jgi:class 3 adenylate cyclase
VGDIPNVQTTRENASDDAEAAIRAELGTSRAVIDVAKHQRLASLSGFPFEVRTSASTREQAGQLADRCVSAYSYPGEVLAFRPRCAVVVLDRADWSERASNPLYGMPYYSARSLFLAGEPSDLAARLEEVAGFCSSCSSPGTRSGLRDWRWPARST